MLISRWFLLCVLLLIKSAICSGLQQGGSSVNEKTSKQIQIDSESYGYHHPPLPDFNDKKESRKEKSIIGNKQISSPVRRSHSLGIGRRARPNADTPSLEIPVQVVYDTEPNPVSSYPSQSTVSPSARTTRVVTRRKQIRSNTNKNIDIRQTHDIGKTNADTYEDAQTITDITEHNDISSTTQFPKRSRESYFKKRTEGPAPRVKIVEEKNFVYAHSGNFHYSFLDGEGTKVSSEGSLRSYDNNKTGEAVSGSVFYKGKDGTDYSLTYTADENGYRPVGAHLPTPPPLPPAIARALKYIADKNTSSPLAKTE